MEDALREVACPVHWISFPSRPTPRLVATSLLEGITRKRSRIDRFTAIRYLVEHLSRDPAIVVVDESQLLTPDCIELLRYLHDRPQTRFALLLVGGNGTWRVLSREPMLESRVYRRVRFEPLRREDVVACMSDYHPRYRDADPDLLGLIDDVFCHGNLRRWAIFTHTAQRLLARTGLEHVDERLARNVFALHGGTGGG